VECCDCWCILRFCVVCCVRRCVLDLGLEFGCVLASELGFGSIPRYVAVDVFHGEWMLMIVSEQVVCEVGYVHHTFGLGCCLS
jgi:hypothetical protein